MDTVASIWHFMVSDAGAGVLLGLLLVSEALASIPGVRANSVFQLIHGLLLKLKRPAANG